MKMSITQSAFTTGKVGKNVINRNDVQQLASAVKELINGVPIEQGPIVSRTGTEFIGEVKFSDKITRLEPFTFSVDQAFVLEIGDFYIRFWVDGGQVVKEYSAWVTATEQSVGDLVTDSGNHYRCLEAHTGGVFATDLAADKWALSGGATDTAYEIVTPYSELVVKALSVAGTADVVYIAHQSAAPRKLSRLSNDSWLIDEIIFEDGPFDALNTDFSATVTLSAITGTVTVTATSDIFLASNEGQLFRIQKRADTLNEGAVALGRIANVASATSASLVLSKTVHADFATDQFSDWRFGAFGGQDSFALDPFSILIAAGAGASEVNLQYVKTDTGASGTSFDQYAWAAADAVFATTLFGLVTYLKTGHAIVKAGATWYMSRGRGLADNTKVLYSAADIDGNPPLTGWSAVDGAAPVPTLSEPAIVVQVGVWPAINGLHQERLIYSATIPGPQKLYFSQVAGYHNFAPTNEFNELLDDSAFTYALSGGGTVDRVEWLLSGQQLIIGTTGAEFVSVTSAQSAPLTPTDVAFTRQSGRGSISNQSPKLVGGTVIYIQTLGNIVRGMSYDVAADRFNSSDLTKFYDTALIDGFSGGSYLPEPSSTLYYYTTNGLLHTLTIEEADGVLAWSDIELGGDGVIRSSAIIPDSGRYGVHLLVQRTISGVNKQYIEKFSQEVVDSDYWRHLDCFIEYHDEITAISTATNLGHLEGETVTIFADGELRGTGVVASGQLALGGSYNHVLIGYPYQTIIQLAPIEGTLEAGSTKGKQKRVVKLTVELTEASTVKAGTSLTELYDLTADEDIDTIFEFEPDDDMKIRSGDLYIVHDAPTPFALSTVTREVEFRD